MKNALQFENETLPEILERLSHNGRSGRPKAWAPRLAEIDLGNVGFFLDTARDPIVDDHEARLQREALHAAGRYRHHLERLLKYRRSRAMRARIDTQRFDDMLATIAKLDERFRAVIGPRSPAGRLAQIFWCLEEWLYIANEEDLPCPKIPKAAQRELLQWARKRA